MNRGLYGLLLLVISVNQSQGYAVKGYSNDGGSAWSSSYSSASASASAYSSSYSSGPDALKNINAVPPVRAFAAAGAQAGPGGASAKAGAIAGGHTAIGTGTNFAGGANTYGSGIGGSSGAIGQQPFDGTGSSSGGAGAALSASYSNNNSAKEGSIISNVISGDGSSEDGLFVGSSDNDGSYDASSENDGKYTEQSDDGSYRDSPEDDETYSSQSQTKIVSSGVAPGSSVSSSVPFFNGQSTSGSYAPGHTKTGCCKGPFPGPKGSIHSYKPAPPGGGGPDPAWLTGPGVSVGSNVGSSSSSGPFVGAPSIPANKPPYSSSGTGSGGSSGLSYPLISSLPGSPGSIHSSKPAAGYPKAPVASEISSTVGGNYNYDGTSSFQQYPQQTPISNNQAVTTNANSIPGNPSGPSEGIPEGKPTVGGCSNSYGSSCLPVKTPGQVINIIPSLPGTPGSIYDSKPAFASTNSNAQANSASSNGAGGCYGTACNGKPQPETLTATFGSPSIPPTKESSAVGCIGTLCGPPNYQKPVIPINTPIPYNPSSDSGTYKPILIDSSGIGGGNKLTYGTNTGCSGGVCNYDLNSYKSDFGSSPPTPSGIGGGSKPNQGNNAGCSGGGCNYDLSSHKSDFGSPPHTPSGPANSPSLTIELLPPLSGSSTEFASGASTTNVSPKHNNQPSKCSTTPGSKSSCSFPTEITDTSSKSSFANAGSVSGAYAGSTTGTTIAGSGIPSVISTQNSPSWLGSPAKPTNYDSQSQTISGIGESPVSSTLYTSKSFESDKPAQSYNIGPGTGNLPIEDNNSGSYKGTTTSATTGISSGANTAVASKSSTAQQPVIKPLPLGQPTKPSGCVSNYCGSGPVSDGASNVFSTTGSTSQLPGPGCKGNSCASPDSSGYYGSLGTDKSRNDFATGSVAIQKPDGSISTDHVSSGSYAPTSHSESTGSIPKIPTNKCLLGNCGSDVGIGSYANPTGGQTDTSVNGFATGSVAIQKPDGSITSGGGGSGSNVSGSYWRSTESIPKIPANKCFGGNCGPDVNIGSHAQPAGQLDKSNNGFATGYVAIQKPDGSVTADYSSPGLNVPISNSRSTGSIPKTPANKCFGGNCGLDVNGGSSAHPSGYSGDGSGNSGAFATGSVSVSKGDGSVSTVGDNYGHAPSSGGTVDRGSGSSLQEPGTSCSGGSCESNGSPDFYGGNTGYGSGNTGAFATGSVLVTKGDGSTSAIGDNPGSYAPSSGAAGTVFTGSGSQGAGTLCTGGPCGTQSSVGSYGGYGGQADGSSSGGAFATGSVAIQRPDGSISTGEDNSGSYGPGSGIPVSGGKSGCPSSICGHSGSAEFGNGGAFGFGGGFNGAYNGVKAGLPSSGIGLGPITELFSPKAFGAGFTKTAAFGGSGAFAGGGSSASSYSGAIAGAGSHSY